MDEYKHENNFKRILSGLQMNDVKMALQRAKKIRKKNKESGYVLQKYKGFEYYKENPSMGIDEVLEGILKDCGVITE